MNCSAEITSSPCLLNILYIPPCADCRCIFDDQLARPNIYRRILQFFRNKSSRTHLGIKRRGIIHRATTDSTNAVRREEGRGEKRLGPNVESFLRLYSGGIASQIRGTFTGRLRHREKRRFRGCFSAVAMAAAVSLVLFHQSNDNSTIKVRTQPPRNAAEGRLMRL